jgi:general stress protein 26
MENSAPTREESIAKLRELVEGIEFAMLTTVEEDGSLRSRPMHTQQLEDDGTLWFFTSTDAPKVHEIERDRHVNVAFASIEKNNYVSMSGRARLVRDRAKIDELWSPPLKAWFPNGKDDPNVGLLRVEVERAEYWDSPSSAIAHAIALAGSLITGKPADPGENEKVELESGKA